ncbi:hypothetical protein [Gracilimonas mengyeensis]|uniref:Lipoprotein n=1 Tax=Gracilimonas mengyeensis TaxID=1302730 RepID=A0A521EI61_9BACT|nr:hypothetical protein [Gracilimonas mengyeensis]SMO83542.1 hypothetical protein SAMN06265219_11260 [Gracilimonas mengyeensis]
MKKLILLALLTFFLISCATSLPSTEPSKEMVKNADTIILKVNQTANEAYRGFAQHLTDQGISIDNSDSELLLLKTSTITDAMIDYRINASIRSNNDSTMIYVSGVMVSDGVVDGLKVDNAGGVAIAGKDVWNNMNELATSYPNESVYYKRN